MKTICYQPSKTCKTAGELKKLLENIPDDMPIQRSCHSDKAIVVRFEQEEGNNDKKWLSVGASNGW